MAYEGVYLICSRTNRPLPAPSIWPQLDKIGDIGAILVTVPNSEIHLTTFLHMPGPAVTIWLVA